MAYAGVLAQDGLAINAPALDFTYTTNGGTITITGYTGPGGAVAIPENITGLPVTSIGIWAFAQCDDLTSVTIPNSVVPQSSRGAFRSQCPVPTAAGLDILNTDERLGTHRRSVAVL